MAFIKQHTYLNGASGNYIALRQFRIDDLTHEASAIFCLYATKQASVDSPETPIVSTFAKLRLYAGDYETYLGTGAAESDPRRSLYLAAKQIDAISDKGPSALKDAEDDI
tara:strand:- start:52 stop:381 length:330 start_codon:yes stop_codon:yes gene_type:complete